MKINVFVGYDTRQHAAYTVCKDSLLDLNGNVQVFPLEHLKLRESKQFWRQWTVDGKGQFWDETDKKPFSTEFSHSRFLVPSLAYEMGLKDIAVFVDSDFLFLSPIRNMILGLDPAKALSVVKHKFVQIDGVKMDGKKQEAYPRKLWSSLMVWNLAHPMTRCLTKDMANTLPGSDLHQFKWLMDNDIGDIEKSWNWIPGLSDPDISPDAIHFSFGGPWMKGFENVQFADLWRAKYRQAVANRLEDGKEQELYAP